jgi:hypothetical protein
MENSSTDAIRIDDTDRVQRLLRIGPATGFDPADWLDCAATFELGREHIAALVCVACDIALHRADPDADEAWAPMHALRALGQFGAVEAVAPILACLMAADDDEVAADEVPVVLSLIGRAAIPSIAAFLSGQSNATSPTLLAMDGLKKIALRHPECRGECIDILTRILKRNVDTDGAINGFAVWNLIDLAAVEAVDAIREAFRRKSVDLSIVGDEQDVEIALGLRTRRSTPRPDFRIAPPGWLEALAAAAVPKNTAPPRRVVKIGRNELCPCGSGKKYKKCCLQ